MSPKVLGVEVAGDKGARHPGREDTDPPGFDVAEKSTKAQVAEFRTGRYSVSIPAAVVLAAVTGLSAAVVAWINKPAPTPPPALTSEQAAALAACATLSRDVTELKMVVRWIEPQIGILLTRTDPRAQTDPREYSAPRKSP